MENNIFYVYVYLDPRKPGDYNYGEFHFDYEPFYVGKGKNGRDKDHLNGSKTNCYLDDRIKEINQTTKSIVIRYKEYMEEQEAYDFETYLADTVGRNIVREGPLCNINRPLGLSGEMSDETRQKIRAAHLGKPLSEETKKKIGERSKGHTLSDEAKEKISKALKGKPLSEEHKKKLSERKKGKPSNRVGKKHSEETKRKISETQKGRPVPEETRQKMLVAQKNRRKREANLQ